MLALVSKKLPNTKRDIPSKKFVPAKETFFLLCVSNRLIGPRINYARGGNLERSKNTVGLFRIPPLVRAKRVRSAKRTLPAAAAV